MRIGVQVILVTLAVSGMICLVAVKPRPDPRPAAQDLGDAPMRLGSFRLAERSGRTVTDADLGDRVWIASFIFTRCPLSCPRISSQMKGLQGQLAGTGIRLVSLSVDPVHDTPPVLAEYGRRFGADPKRWWLVTGPPDEVLGLVHDRFHLTAMKTSPAERKEGAESIEHSTRLALVDRGNKVIGFFDSTDPEAVKALVKRARQRDLAWVPAWNAAFNGASAVVLVLAYLLIRTGRVRGHAACMALAILLSALFLGSYLVYHARVGSVSFRGIGMARFVYFVILLSHTVLAAGVVPLVVATLSRALRRRFPDHAAIARVTFPIWLYVSVTGVLVYLMLYQLPVPTVSG